jgi:methylmalonyl-CoA/ethylmalonyl-CoA epimerase
MIQNIDHIGIAVADVAAANTLFARLLGREHYKIEEVQGEGVFTSFFQVGGTKIELVAATRPDSPIAKFVAKRGEGIHHIAIEVTDIRAEMLRLQREGFELLNDEPKRGADNKLICFLHPKTTNGVLVELCESILLAQ